MLGWPLNEKRPSVPPVVTEESFLSREDGYSIYRLQFEVLDGLRMVGLLFRLDGEGKKPLVIAQHGGCGTPEMIGDVYGTTYNYNEMVHRVLRRGAHVFAPQLLLWSTEMFGAPYSRQEIDTRLKRVGSSIAALEIYGIERILDYFETVDYVGKFGMVGLLYGGFYSLYTAAVDTRIQSTVSCSWFCARDPHPWSDWTWKNLAMMFDDAEVACLVYPRRINLQMGKNDDLFDYHVSEASFAEIKAICAAEGADTDWGDLVLFDGPREFCREEWPLDKMLEDLQA